MYAPLSFPHSTNSRAFSMAPFLIKISTAVWNLPASTLKRTFCSLCISFLSVEYCARRARFRRIMPNRISNLRESASSMYSKNSFSYFSSLLSASSITLNDTASGPGPPFLLSCSVNILLAKSVSSAMLQAVNRLLYVTRVGLIFLRCISSISSKARLILFIWPQVLMSVLNVHTSGSIPDASSSLNTVKHRSYSWLARQADISTLYVYTSGFTLLFSMFS
mmetsp:Transcript_3950/g.7196  ORF Transcript_3950/g.7196 Transcript_3950/m.7196 type:complete len:221 (-) Transcript_3950:1104-1766(-)